MKIGSWFVHILIHLSRLAAMDFFHSLSRIVLEHPREFSQRMGLRREFEWNDHRAIGSLACASVSSSPTPPPGKPLGRSTLRSPHEPVSRSPRRVSIRIGICMVDLGNPSRLCPSETHDGSLPFFPWGVGGEDVWRSYQVVQGTTDNVRSIE